MDSINIAALQAFPGSTVTSASPGLSGVQGSFLDILLAQLSNQDPLNATDNLLIATQLGRLPGLGSSSLLGDALGQGIGLQISQAAGLIGRDVMALGDSLQLGGGMAAGAVLLGQSADKVSVEVLGPGGTPVASIDLGKQSAGIVNFSWDGKDFKGATQPDGQYTFRVTASQNIGSSGSTPVDAQTLAVGEVTSIGINNLTAGLTLDGGRQFAFADLRQIL